MCAVQHIQIMAQRCADGYIAFPTEALARRFGENVAKLAEQRDLPLANYKASS